MSHVRWATKSFLWTFDHWHSNCKEGHHHWQPPFTFALIFPQVNLVCYIRPHEQLRDPWWTSKPLKGDWKIIKNSKQPSGIWWWEIFLSSCLWHRSSCPHSKEPHFIITICSLNSCSFSENTTSLNNFTPGRLKFTPGRLIFTPCRVIE